jgi:hypothetical protein
MRRALSGLGGWLAMAWLAVACSYEIDSKLCLEDDHCDKGEVCMLSHACIACSGDVCPAHERCAADGDCGDDEVCSGDGLCRVRCVVDAQCISGKCDEPACAAPIGEPCLAYETPCVGDTRAWSCSATRASACRRGFEARERCAPRNQAYEAD